MKRERWQQPALPGTAPGVASNDGAPPANDGGGLDDVLGGSTLGAVAKPTTREKRARGGRRAQRAGRELEDWVAALLSSAQAAHVIGHWHRVEVPTVAVRVQTTRGWEWYREFSDDAHADFEAIGAAPERRSIVIECKSVEGSRLLRSDVLPQQVLHLDAAAVSLLVVEFRDEGPVCRAARQYCVPWRLTPWAVARSAAGIDEAAVELWRIRHGGQFFDRLRGSTTR